MDDTTTRRLEGLEALADVVRQYPDVFGPQCWCLNDECRGDCGEQPPPTVGFSGFVVICEWDDLAPDGKCSTTWGFGAGANPNKALGMTWRAARRF